MKILVVHNRYRYQGGEDAVFADETALLENAGHEVIRWTADNRNLEARSRIEIMRTALWNRDSARECIRLIKQHVPDIVHFHNTFGVLSPAVLSAARTTRTPVVQTLHNFRSLCLNATLLRNGAACDTCVSRRIALPGIIHACYRQSRTASAGMAVIGGFHRMRRTLERAVTRFIVPSAFAQRVYAEAMLPVDQIDVKANPIAGGNIRAHLPGTHVLYAGRLSEEKGIEHLINAWQGLHDVPLIIAGDGPMRESLVEQSNELPITFAGHQTRGELDRLLANARFVIAPSVAPETFGLGVAEAFRAGVPAIASDLGALPELVQDGTTGFLVPPGSVTDLMNATRRLWNSRNSTETMGRNAREFYEHNLTDDAIGGALERIYERAIRDAAQGM